MRQYWPCAVHRRPDGLFSPLITYDSVLSLEEARKQVALWQHWFKFDVIHAWADVYENGIKVEKIEIMEEKET